MTVPMGAPGGRFQYARDFGALLSNDIIVSALAGSSLIGLLYIEQIQGYSTAAATRWFQLHTAALTLGAVPRWSIPVPAGMPFAWQPPAPGFWLENPSSARWAVSSTGATYTASADLFWVNIQGRVQLRAT